MVVIWRGIVVNAPLRFKVMMAFAFILLGLSTATAMDQDPLVLKQLTFLVGLANIILAKICGAQLFCSVRGIEKLHNDHF
mmetsp:Transcript_44029/g.171855  ORF Transcript_44029/g.171855 Transcript_44029/m.171855 type:complete len:80 (+) Transcript_44029:745-984(+)